MVFNKVISLREQVAKDSPVIGVMNPSTSLSREMSAFSLKLSTPLKYMLPSLKESAGREIAPFALSLISPFNPLRSVSGPLLLGSNSGESGNAATGLGFNNLFNFSIFSGMSVAKQEELQESVLQEGDLKVEAEVSTDKGVVTAASRRIGDTIFVEISSDKGKRNVVVDVKPDGVKVTVTRENGKTEIMDMSFKECMNFLDKIMGRKKNKMPSAVEMRTFSSVVTTVMTILGERSKTNNDAKLLQVKFAQLLKGLQAKMRELDMSTLDADQVAVINELNLYVDNELAQFVDIAQQGIDRAEKINMNSSIYVDETGESIYGSAMNEAGAEFNAQVSSDEHVEFIEEDAQKSADISKAQMQKHINDKANNETENIQQIIEDAA